MLPSVPLRDLASAGSTRLEVPLRLRGRPAPSLKERRGTGPSAATRWVAHLAQFGRYRPGAFAHGRAGRQAIATAAPLRSGILHALRGLLSGSSPLSWSSPLWVPSLNHLPSTAPLGADSLLHTIAGNPFGPPFPSPLSPGGRRCPPRVGEYRSAETTRWRRTGAPSRCHGLRAPLFVWHRCLRCLPPRPPGPVGAKAYSHGCRRIECACQAFAFGAACLSPQFGKVLRTTRPLNRRRSSAFT